MKSDEQIAEDVLLRTLMEVRTARTRRRTLKLASATSGAILLGIAFFPRPGPLSNTRPRVVETVEEYPAARDEVLAVMVWRDGEARFEWVGTDDLGEIELQFSLDPVFAFADDDL